MNWIALLKSLFGTPAGASVSADIAAIKADTATITALVASGLAYKATVTTYTDTTHFKSTDLIGLGDNFFFGTKPWYVYPVWKFGGSGGAPQGESQPTAAFTSADGTVQHTAFTVHLEVNDRVLMVHPAVAYMLGLTPTRAGYLDNLSGGAVALAASWTAGLATALGNYTAARAAYLDNINQAGLLQVTAARAALLDQITALRLAELDAANLPADVDTLIARITAARAANLDNATYLEQTIPIMMNSLQTLTGAQADKDFIATNTRGGQGLISTDNAKMQKAFLVIIGRAVNVYAGTNALDCTTAAHNQWKMNLDGGAYADLVNGAFADGQMLDNDWRCNVDGAIHPFTLMFDISAVLVANVDGLIGVRLENGRSEQSSMLVDCDIYLKVLWKL